MRSLTPNVPQASDSKDVVATTPRWVPPIEIFAHPRWVSNLLFRAIELASTEGLH